MERTLPALRWRLGYRPGLNGIRGLAILLVVAGHLNLPGLDSGGGVGVTMFFVLSGFLITTLLWQEVAGRGAIGLARFYARRALRLLPALAAFLLIVTAARLWIGDPLAGPHAAAVASYGANWYRVLTGDQLGALSHTWSLAIEEQFYVVWPLLLIGILRVSRATPRTVLAIMLGGVLAVTVWRTGLVIAGADLYRVYLGTDTRADALLMGAATAAAVQWRPWKLPVWSGYLAAIALVPLIAMPDLASEALHVTGGITIPVIVTAILILRIAQGEGRFLSMAPLRYAGLISYALYLWHFPIIGWTGTFGLGFWPRAVLAVVLSLVAAIASYVLIERPALSLKQRVGPATPATIQPTILPVFAESHRHRRR